MRGPLPYPEMEPLHLVPVDLTADVFQLCLHVQPLVGHGHGSMDPIFKPAQALAGRLSEPQDRATDLC